MKQKIETMIFSTEGAIDMQSDIDDFASEGWLVKQVSTTNVDLREGAVLKPHMAITLLLEKPD